MTNKKNRQIALLMAASLFMNMLAPSIQAEEITTYTEPGEIQGQSAESQDEIPIEEGEESNNSEQQETEETADQIVVSDGETDQNSAGESEQVILSEDEEETQDLSADSTEKSAMQQEQFQQATEPYLAMSVSKDRSMSLEWWYVVTGKVSESDLTVDENGEYQLVFPDNITVNSAEEMILLSYVNPEIYEDQKIILSADEEENYDLTDSVTLRGESEDQASLTYQGLGSQEHPFSGTISYNKNSEEMDFILNAPLFIGLSCKAEFLNDQENENTVSLISKSETAFDGLLAQHVYGKSGVTANWRVCLSAPEKKDDVVYHLPSLFGTLHEGSNVHLTLTDNSAQEPSDKGYLCAVMLDDAILETENITRQITVPMVGELADKATLTVHSAPEGFQSEEEFQKLVDYYRTMEVVPGEMPLEWWFVVSDRLDKLKEYLEWKAEQTDSVNTNENIALFADENSESGTSEAQSVDLENISDPDELIKLSYTKASEYQKATITITSRGAAYDLTKEVNDSGKTLTFQGLGSNEYPFQGTFKYNDASENTYLTLNRSLFQALSTEATVSRVNLACAVQKGDTSADGIFAANIVAGSSADKKLSTNVFISKAGGLSENETWVIPSLVSRIGSGAKVNLTAAFTGSDIPKIDANGFFSNTIESRAELTVNYPDNMPGFDTRRDNVGGLVGTMEAAAKLSVEDSEKDIVIDVVTTGTSAGGLVGTMEDGATLSINAKSLTVNRVSASTGENSYVGSLAATAVNPVFEFGNLTKISAGTPSVGNTHLTGYFVGGMVGKMDCSGGEKRLTVLPVNGLKMSGNDCGGLFAELDNSCNTLTILSDTENILVDGATFSCSASNPGTQSAGGLIGWYNPKKEECKLIANNITAKSSSTGFAYVGGLIGSATGTYDASGHHDMELTGCNVEISSNTGSNSLGGIVGSLRVKTVYLKVSGTVVNEKHSNSQVFGGLVAYADDQGDLIEVGEVNLTRSYITDCSGSAGGLVGQMDSGVLYMTEKPELDFTNMITNSPDTRGWILGNRGNVLVCTTAPKWFDRTDDKDTNDTGVWGQVLQLSKFGEGQTLVKIDDMEHTCTIGALPSSDTNGYKISSLTDFAAVALRMQLNPKGLLQFEGEDIEANADVKLKLENDIELDGTGLTGLTRDKATKNGDATERHSISITADEKRKITLPNTTVYAVGNGGKSHSHQGLIAEVKDLTLSNLTIDGRPNVKSLDNDVRCGIANDIYGNATLTNVTSSVKWIDNATNNSATISGILTYLVDTDNNRSKEVSITGCEWNGSIETKCSVTDGRSAAGFIGYGKAKSIKVENCTIAGTITKATNDTANLGGLAAVLQQVDTLNINGLTVSNTVNAKSAANATGGLLGYQWKSDQTTFSVVTVKGATLNTPKARFGGLVYSGSGYWKVEKNGITFSNEKANTFDGTSNNSKTSGLILADGFLEKNGLYLEVLYDGYKIEDNAVSFGKIFEYFDELVGKSINTTADGNYSGIVSIATSDSTETSERKIDQKECNTYRDKTTKTPYKNLNTRYYYNLDLFRENQSPEGAVDTSEKMVLWSAYNSCATNLQGYFKKWDNKNITGELDLRGYSFYPVPFEGTSITKANITFGFEQLEVAEKNAKNKSPSDTNRQHAGMHTGIFTSAVNDSQDTPDMQLSVSNLTLAGTVGGLNNTYGAIVRGNVQGKDAEHITTLAISGVTLNGIRVYNADATNGDGSYNVAPLLINSIGSYTTMNLDKVQTATDQYQTGSDTSIKTVKAASSLIGNVGSATAAEIKLYFSNMRLAESGKSEDKCNIFTHALFLESFQYQSGTCQGTYNFKQDNEDGYTLGKEIQNTNSGRNREKQYWFFGEEGEENEIYKRLNMSGNASTAFNDYPRYVCVEENNTTNHELDINLPAVNLEEGCGTYSHPYLIDNAGQFKALAEALTATPRADWKVTVTEAVLESGSFAEQDGHTEESKTDVQYRYDATSEKWISTGENSTQKEIEKIRDYLRNAYYKVTADITLESWNGLGGSDPNQRFRGVIVGADKNKFTITINGGNETQFGGLIAFSSGSVVKDLTIKYTGNIGVGLVNNATPSSTASASFFGGVVGWCIGGDTIIDNVSVDYTSATITAESRYTAVGGYVGLVGGASEQGGGGVVFRGNVASTLNQNNSTQYYKNPYVGRVLDGYVVSETKGIDNEADNYPIPYLTNTPKLSFDDSTVNIGNAEGLWLFSAMENSCHGEAYSAGKSRAGDYNKIGQTVGKSELIDEKSSDYTETDFYLWKHFNIASAIPSSALTLNINADCDMTSFGNAFRGIGVSQGNLAVNTTDSVGYSFGSSFLQIARVDGKNHTITLKQERKEHQGESTYWASMGTGLFPIMYCANSTEINDLTLKGSTSLKTGYTFTNDDRLFNTQHIRIGAGMLAGAIWNKKEESSSISISNVKVEDGTVDANVPFVGGIVGYCGEVLQQWKQISKISMNDCGEKNIKVVGRTNVGGGIGYTYAECVEVKNFKGTEINVNAANQYTNIRNNTNAALDYSNGMGGMFGLVYNGKLNVDGVKINELSIKNNNTTDIGTDIGFGGLVGSTNAPVDSDGYMKNIKLMGKIEITDEKAHVSTGGLIGYLADTKINGWDTGDTSKSAFVISNVEIGNAKSSQITLKGYQVGGLIGMVKDGSVTMTIGNENVENAINAVKIGNSSSNDANVKIMKSDYDGKEFCLSGVIGITCNNPIINIQNLELNKISVEKANYTSLILAKNMKASTNLKIQNMQASNCEIAASTKGQSGFIYGKSDGTNNKLNVTGYNMLLKNCTIDTVAKALFGGDNSAGTSKLVAVSVVDCTGEGQDFSADSADSYVIRANYTGTETNTTGSSEPYVPVNPIASGALGDTVAGLTITGDGAAFMADGTTAIGEQIAEDTQNSNIDKSKTYYNVVTDAGKYYADADNSKPRISTYSVAGDNTTTGQSTSGGSSGTDSSTAKKQPNDFPVLLLPAVGKTEVNDAVYKYISLLTNFNANSSSLKGKLQTNGNITVATYRWDGSQFTKVTDETPSLTVGQEDGTISATTGCYDNTKNQFTLLDVPFQDPTDASNTYHLYIPVVVQKLLNYRFSAAASVGTNYYTSHYDSLRNQVLASHGEQVTTLLTFEYERTKAEWQTAIENGENLLWDFDKNINLVTESNDNLPKDTQLTLVDRNNQNKAYFATYDGSATTLKFNTFDGYGKDHSYLCDGLNLSVTEAAASESEGKVQYVKLSGASGATLRIADADGTYSYYRPATDGETGQKYTITVNGDDEDKFLLKQQFYLTIQTPAKSQNFVNIQIQCESNLTNNNSTDMIPNRLIRQENREYYTRNGSENRIVIGDFFKETVTVTSASEERMSDTNNSINLDIQSVISFVDATWANRYQTYAKGTNLYQRFDLQLKQWRTFENSESVNFVSGTGMDVKYYKDNVQVEGGGAQTLPDTSVVSLEFPEGIEFTASSATDVTLKAEVTLTYDTAGINKQFIKRSTDTAREGLQFVAFSHLAYSKDALQRSSVSSSDSNNTSRFYRTEYELASLRYNVIGSDEHMKNGQLGVNGLVPEENKISSYATYNISDLGTLAASATNLRYEIQLMKKENTGEYRYASEPYSINNMRIEWLGSNGQSQSKSNIMTMNGTIPLENGLDPSASIRFNIPLTIQTGSELEKESGTYSNYMVKLTVSLYNGGSIINGSTATDYIIYTNAKIVTTLIEETETSQ